MPGLITNSPKQTMASRKHRRTEKRRSRNSRRQAHKASIPAPVQRMIDIMGAQPHHIDYSDSDKWFGVYEQVGRIQISRHASTEEWTRIYIHERFHAHQHQVVRQEIGQGNTIDWQRTREGRAFREIGGWTFAGPEHPAIYSESYTDPVEEAASVYEACAAMVISNETGIVWDWSHSGRAGGYERAAQVVQRYRPWFEQFFPEMPDPFAPTTDVD